MAIKKVTAILNGEAITLTYNSSSSKYEASITAPTKSSNRMKRDASITGTVSGSDLTLKTTTASDKDLNYTTVYKNGEPLSDTLVTWTSDTALKVTGRTDTTGWAVEYRTKTAVDGGTNGSYNVFVKAEDQAGNVSTSSLQASNCLQVKEKTVPTISKLVPNSGAKVNNAKPTISGTLADADSGINTASFSLTIDSGTAIKKGSPGLTLSTSSFSYVPPKALGEGKHNFVVSVKDNDGNTSTSSSISFTVDTIPPALNITNPDEGAILNSANLKVTGTTETTGITITIKLNGADQGAVPVSSGSFSKVIALSSGANTIEVKATDSAGNVTTVSRKVTLDTVAPTITAIELVPNPVDGGATFIIKVTASDN